MAQTKQDIVPGSIPPAAMYKLMISMVVPRPIAWVSTFSADGVANAAPHSYFMILSTDPPILGFSSVGTKDTLRNIQATGDYVVNIAGDDLADQLNLTSGDFPPDESEFVWAGLTLTPSVVVKAPAIAEAPISIEVRLRDILPFGNVPNHLIVGDVLHIRVAASILHAGGEYVEPHLLRAIGRMGGPTFCRTSDLFSLERPRYADLSEERQR